MRGFGRGIVVAAVAVVLTLAPAACGGSGGGGDSGGETTTYENAQYGFSITYGDPLSLVTLTPSGGEEYAIAFADKDGPVVEDQYANGIRVAVNEMSQSVKAADVPGLLDEITPVLEDMVTAVPDGKLTGAVTPVEINGTPGFYVDYQYMQGGEQLSCRVYVLLKGSNEFDITTQAVAGDWDDLRGTLEQTVQTFTVE